ncbi:MAG: WecB/TagA/CpsF family glycosyltransferase [Phenylobacterium sp.]|uniref:WecB/TagA/CpsF family glycosyltransferase n=1 Tax=Phenylobacterium sp. TaxID=1871053 RepID=UPI00391A09C7
MLGADVDLVRPEEVMHHVEAAVGSRTPFLVANHNLHSLYLTRRDPGLGRFFDQADLVEVDSTPLIFFTKLLGLHSRQFHRCTYLDWRDHFWSLANRKGWRIFYLGGAPGVAEKAKASLTARYPRAQIATRHGYFDAAPGSDANADLLAEIAAYRPDILFVGMGMPRQEQWILDHRGRLPPCVTFSVGAAFDYEAGVQRAAPRWMGRAGLEWMFRLAVDPRRLFRRYCIEPWFLIGPATRDLFEAFAAGRLLRKPPAARPQSVEA